jgi:hypothetical protein
MADRIVAVQRSLVSQVADRLAESNIMAESNIKLMITMLLSLHQGLL